MASRQRESLRGRREGPKDEQTSRSVKKAAAGCLTFVLFMTLIAISPLFCEDPYSTDGIGDNLSAVQLVEVGMTEREVLDLMNKPTRRGRCSTSTNGTAATHGPWACRRAV